MTVDKKLFQEGKTKLILRIQSFLREILLADETYT